LYSASYTTTTHPFLSNPADKRNYAEDAVPSTIIYTANASTDAFYLSNHSSAHTQSIDTTNLKATPPQQHIRAKPNPKSNIKSNPAVSPTTTPSLLPNTLLPKTNAPKSPRRQISLPHPYPPSKSSSSHSTEKPSPYMHMPDLQLCTSSNNFWKKPKCPSQTSASYTTASNSMTLPAYNTTT
jgi:hypothetical protein